MATTEERIKHFAESLYAQLVAILNRTECDFALLTKDNNTFPEFPGVNSANLWNILIGGDSTGTATFAELMMARLEFEVLCCRVLHSVSNFKSNRPITKFSEFPKYDVKKVLLDQMQASTLLITERIWSPDVQKKYIR
jgi:hypothetical protein